MPKLILVKHSLPTLDPAAPAASWRLAPEGLRRCRALAEHLRAYAPGQIVSSAEPKAQATASAVADALAMPWRVAEGLEEHHRRSAPFLADEAFRQAVAAMFDRPGELVFGEETADQAAARFGRAVDALAQPAPADPLVVVAHGTVIALHLARRAGVAPFPLWSRLGLPSFVSVELPSYAIGAVVEHVL
ncbi:histidine phosphatase family protein [Chloroflexia bacterium SDU3-3]|nr:histidine phosphatase family protein [Chloroflexia bacterium SDU3-3]